MTDDKIVVRTKCPICHQEYGLSFTILQLQRLIAAKKSILKEERQYRKITGKDIRGDNL